MGGLSVVLSGVAAYLLFTSGHTMLMIVAIATTIGCFWSWGVMHNFATDAAKRRSDYTGRFYDFTRQEADAVPNWITVVNMVFSILGVVLLIAGIVFKVRVYF